MAAARERTLHLPPTYFAVALALMGFFHHVAPAAQLFVAPYRYAGIVLTALSIGLAGALLGAAVLMGSLTPFIVIPAFMALLADRFIEREEALLERTFGPQYLDYKARVRRWL